MDRLANMRVFAKVVENGSFAGAAARLSISASMVSQHVKELEERLGARLLNRTTRKVSVTEVGRAYYERCTRVLADIEEADRAAGDMQTSPRGDLRVNSTPCFGAHHVGSAIVDFAARFPDISVELMLSDRLVDLVDEGFDVAVRLEQLPDSRLIARKLASCRLVLCGAPDYFAEHGTPRMPADLSDHNCLELTASSFFRRWHLTDGSGTELHLSLKGTVRSNYAAVLVRAAWPSRRRRSIGRSAALALEAQQASLQGAAGLAKAQGRQCQADELAGQRAEDHARDQQRAVEENGLVLGLDAGVCLQCRGQDVGKAGQRENAEADDSGGAAALLAKIFEAVPPGGVLVGRKLRNIEQGGWLAERMQQALRAHQCQQIGLGADQHGSMVPKTRAFGSGGRDHWIGCGATGQSSGAVLSASGVL